MYFDKEFYWDAEYDTRCRSPFTKLHNCQSTELPLYELEEGEILSNKTTLRTNILDDDDVLTIPKINQCTLCEGYRLSKFRYCFPCMIQYNAKWYQLYITTEQNIVAIHNWEKKYGYKNSTLRTKVQLHGIYGDPVFIAANRLGSLIAHQHLLPSHEAHSDHVMTHKFAAIYYLRSAIKDYSASIEFVGSNIHITSRSNIFLINMLDNNIMERIYTIIKQLTITKIS